MLKLILIALFPFFLLFGDSSDNLPAAYEQPSQKGETGTREKLIVATGSVAIDLDLNRIKGTSGAAKGSQMGALHFDVERDSFFTVVVFNGELRGPYPGSMGLVPQTSAELPSKLNASVGQLIVENVSWGGAYEMVVRDSKTGFIFFNIDGPQFDYDANARELNIQEGRLLLSKEFSAELGPKAEAGAVVGNISIVANMRPIEVMEIVDGEIRSDVMPSVSSPEAGTVPGPDVIVGNLFGLAQFGGASGTQVGLAVGTDSCNAGTIDLNWFALPSNDHPVIPQNLYRMSGGANNDERFEQIGQSNVKHAFQALTENICGFGCNGVGDTHLGSGCSDPYTASLNAGGNNALGSRAWINPFDGAFPRGDSVTPPNSHSGHSHTGPSHRILTEMSDLNTALNAGATYYAEAQYITPHEYEWCKANPGQCNMYNNVSYRKYTVTGTGSPFSFSSAAATERQKSAIEAWNGATIVDIQPDPGNDGVGAIAYKVTNTSPGVWHYEYAIHNQNLDRAIQSFAVSLAGGATVSNVGFHAPPQHPGWTADGTVGNAGFSSAPWTQTVTAGSMAWNAETFAQNPNANAIRWGTLYNFRFDSNLPPQIAVATVGFLKTGAPINVQVQGPGPVPTPTPTPTTTPMPTPTPTPAPLTISIGNVSQNEGNSGTVAFTFNVTISGQPPLAGPVSVEFATVDGTATIADNDYLNASGTLAFTSVSPLVRQVVVLVNGDTAFESNEAFVVRLSNAVGATILQADGIGTIVNDDVMPVIEGDVVDANGGPAGDGIVLSNDVTVISQMVLGNIPSPVTPAQFQRADVNEPCGNGGIDAGDVTVISQYLLGNLPPRAACGVTVPAIVNLIEASFGFGPR